MIKISPLWEIRIHKLYHLLYHCKWYGDRNLCAAECIPGNGALLHREQRKLLHRWYPQRRYLLWQPGRHQPLWLRGNHLRRYLCQRIRRRKSSLGLIHQSLLNQTHAVCRAILWAAPASGQYCKIVQPCLCKNTRQFHEKLPGVAYNVPSVEMFFAERRMYAPFSSWSTNSISLAVSAALSCFCQEGTSSLYASVRV